MRGFQSEKTSIFSIDVEQETVCEKIEPTLIHKEGLDPGRMN